MKGLRLNQEVGFLYPAHNYHGVMSKFESRRMRVESIRDISKDPLNPMTIELQPLLRRGRVLITGLDLDKGEQRSFYVDSMRALEPL